MTRRMIRHIDDRVLVFDNKLWREAGGDVGDNSQFWKEATILYVGFTDDVWRDEIATVRFDHDGRISRGHFTNGMKEIA